MIDSEIFVLIANERKRQLEKWGVQQHTPGEWTLILVEEIGEACQAFLERRELDAAHELIQAAAVVVAWIKSAMAEQEEEENKMLNISDLEKTWEFYLHDDSLNYLGKLNLAGWMGERMGPVLKEVKRLRAALRAAANYLEGQPLNVAQIGEANSVPPGRTGSGKN